MCYDDLLSRKLKYRWYFLFLNISYWRCADNKKNCDAIEFENWFGWIEDIFNLVDCGIVRGKIGVVACEAE